MQEFKAFATVGVKMYTAIKQRQSEANICGFSLVGTYYKKQQVHVCYK